MATPSDATSRAASDDILRMAVDKARSGDLSSAREMAEDALRTGKGEAVSLHALLGMIFARLGDVEGAASHLRDALAARPLDVTIACNLIAILMDAGREAEALEVATAQRAAADQTMRIARYRGFLAQKLEYFDDAVQAYEAVLAKAPTDFESWNNLGNARAGRGDAAGAVEALKRAIAIDSRVAPTWLNLASALFALDKPEDGERILQEAAQRFPDDPKPQYQLYIGYKAALRQDEAIASLEQAAARDPSDADLQLKLGIEYGVVRRTTDAERAYRNALALDPAKVDAYLGLAIQYEHMNRETDFAPLIALARDNGVGEGPLAFIEAMDLRRAGHFEQGLDRLDAVPADLEPVRTHHLRATLLERLKRTDEAFASYARANAMMEEEPSDPRQRGAKLRADLAQELALLTPDWRDSWQSAEIADGREDPVFLVGFPRSGTTLLDTILMGHARTVVLEEQPPLNIVEDEIGGMAAIAAMDSDAIARARRRYFEEVDKIEHVEPGQLLIDKSPLFLYRLPLIQRLFPKARIILALRHPCDVVLSCYMSSFRLNSAMSNFLRLEDTAAFYDICFDHWSRARTLFDADIFPIVYEELVEDVESQVRPLLDWLGLDWHADVLDHSRTARSRGLITTASYSQVTEPIYRRASGRWKRYAAHLEPVIDTLAPWAERFGYGDPREKADPA